jgi:hypothetical protein
LYGASLRGLDINGKVSNRNCSAKIDVAFLNKLRGAFSVSTRTAVAVNDCRGILYVSQRRSIRGGIESRGFDAAERERQLRGGDVARMALVGALGSYCTFQAARPIKEPMPHALALWRGSPLRGYIPRPSSSQKLSAAKTFLQVFYLL